MNDTTSTTVAAVRGYLAARRTDPRYAGPDAVAAAAALRLAVVLDGADSGSGAANASRELRQQLELLRLTEVDPLPTGDELRRQRADSQQQQRWAAIMAELEAAGDADDDGDQAGPTHAW